MIRFKRQVLFGVAALLFGAGTMAHAQTDAQGFIRVAPENIVFKDAGNGVKFATIYGDPTKPGPYVIRVIFPVGIMSSPHFHSEERHVVVVKGTWFTGTDDKWDPSTAIGLPAGSYMYHPAGGVHFDGALKDEVTVQIVGVGPSKTTFLYPKEGGFGTPHKLN
jgi:quercetin dioxygenase-like cupin family protein